MYYDDALTSVYMTDTQTQGFQACFLLKKEFKDEYGLKYACWDIIHTVVCTIVA